MGKKQEVILALFEACRNNGNWVFDNDAVETVCRRVGFKNKFDATKLDNQDLLPEALRQQDYAVIHLGRGRHQFIQGIHRVYHTFEAIPDENTVAWQYRPSLLNNYNTSEANVLSVANNQRILHHFLFGLDREFAQLAVEDRPKTYFPHRTKSTLRYRFGDLPIELDSIQLEIDLTIEYQGHIGVFEAKNGEPGSFAVYQLYHPFLYYHLARPSLAGRVQSIRAVYVTRQRERQQTVLNLWAYTFADPLDITSIELKKSAIYRLTSPHVAE